jgi:hypothetical protein
MVQVLVFHFGGRMPQSLIAQEEKVRIKSEENFLNNKVQFVIEAA